ncbi:MAG: hypothetical protein ACJ79R_23160 [Anaeromyxobacteraceae bacterium]
MHLILNPSGAALDGGATRARARLVLVQPPAQRPRAHEGGGRVELTLLLAALLALSFAISS